MKDTFYARQCSHIRNKILPFLSIWTITSYLSEPNFRAWLQSDKIGKKCALANTTASISWIALVIQNKYLRTLRVSPFLDRKETGINYSLELSTLRHSVNLKCYKIKNLKPYNVPDLGKVHHQGKGLSSKSAQTSFFPIR